MVLLHNLVNKLGIGARSAARKLGAIPGKIGRGLYNNRDLISKAIGVAAPVAAGGLLGGVPGVIAAGLAQKDEIKSLAKKAVRRFRGKDNSKPSERKVDQDALKKAISVAKEPAVRKKILGGKMKELAQGQSIS